MCWLDIKWRLGDPVDRTDFILGITKRNEGRSEKLANNFEEGMVFDSDQTKLRARRGKNLSQLQVQSRGWLITFE